MPDLDTHYWSGEDIRAGDRVQCGDWSGVVAFVIGSVSFAPGFAKEDWDYLERGFMVDFHHGPGLVFFEQADEDLSLIERG